MAAGHGVDIKADFPHVTAWMGRIGQRPSAKVRITDPREDKVDVPALAMHGHTLDLEPEHGRPGPSAGWTGCAEILIDA